MDNWRIQLPLGLSALLLAPLMLWAGAPVVALLAAFLAGATLMFALALWREE